MTTGNSRILFFAPGIEGGGDCVTELRKHGGEVFEAVSLPELLKELGSGYFDLAVLGATPGSENITDLSATIRSICQVPVLFLLPEGTVSEYIDQVKNCADDFLLCPVRHGELKLRAELVLSCNSKRGGRRQRDSFPLGNMIFDFKNQLLETPEGVKHMTLTEARLLHLLCLYRNNVLPRKIALETIWGENDYFKSRSMDVYVAKLRRLMSADSSVSISNVHRVGFRLEVKDTTNG